MFTLKYSLSAGAVLLGCSSTTVQTSDAQPAATTLSDATRPDAASNPVRFPDASATNALQDAKPAPNEAGGTPIDSGAVESRGFDCSVGLIASCYGPCNSPRATCPSYPCGDGGRCRGCMLDGEPCG